MITLQNTIGKEEIREDQNKQKIADYENNIENCDLNKIENLIVLNQVLIIIGF